MAWSRRPSAPSACATASSPIPTRSPPISINSCRRHFSTREAGENRRQESSALAGAARRRRHDLDGRGGRIGPRRLLYPVDLLGVRLRLRAAGDRHPHAEPRLELFARSQRAQCARARPPAVPHAQSGAGRAQGRPRHRLWHHGRRRPAADAGRGVHALRHLRPAARSRRSTRRAGCSAAPGAPRTPISGSNPVSTATWSTG